MLHFLKFSTHTRQHIIPPHVKYIVISAIIIFSIFSSQIPALGILYTKSYYRDAKKITTPKKLEKIIVTSAPIKKTMSNTRVASKPTGGHQSALHKDLKESSSQVAKVIPTNTPVPTVAPTVAQVQEAVVPGDAKGQLFAALNSYRQKKGKSQLSWSDTLAGFAQGRAEQFDREGKMDNHAGFHDLINNNGFSRMGFLALAENSSFGDTRDPVFIIESLYGQSPGHDANQLNGEYTHVGIGASGKATDLLFGGRKK
jgi:uncharacterized protein YkwD